MDHCEKEKRKRNPRETANIFSLLTFAYTGSLFKKAFKDDLEEKDLYEVLKDINSKKCGDKIEKQWIRENKEDGPPSICHLMWKRFGRRYLFIGLVDFTWRTFNSLVEPLVMSSLISYFKPGQTTYTKNDAYFYAGMIIVLYIFRCIYMHNFIIWLQKLGIEIKTAFSSLLYRKALKLTPTAISDITLGNIVTLITKDVHTFLQAMWMLNDTWIGILQTCFICYLLYRKIGFISFIGVGVLLSGWPIQIIIGKYVSKMRLATGKKSDERLQVTQETLSSIRIIKMYTWEKYFSQKIYSSRLSEMSKLLYAFYLRIVIVMIGMLFSRIGFYALIMSYSWLGYATDAELVFYILTIFKDLKFILGVTIPYGMGRAAELYSALCRINNVIKAEELRPNKGHEEKTEDPLIEIKDASVSIKDFEILTDVSFKMKTGLLLITGTVGSGKSSLMKTILQDYPLDKGSLTIRGRVSYASQDPWLFPSSIRQNITFGQKFNEKRYKEVVRVCALEYDFRLFDNGDETIVADRGLNLSRGQQARVNLARAIYKDSEIYLLDDSLTALDTHVQDFIFYECIKKFLKHKICVLVTQTANHIREADYVMVMQKGRIKYYGIPDAKVIEVVNEIAVEDDDLEKEVIEDNNANEGDDLEEKKEHEKLLETEQYTTKKKVYGEINKKGEVSFSVYKRYFMFGGGLVFMTINLVLFAVTQGTDSYSDKLLTQWVDEQHQVLELKSMMEDEINTTSSSTILAAAVDQERFTLKLCSIMILVSTVLSLIKVYSLYEFCKRASINIHNSMIKHVVRAVMSFFDSHFIGNILNRFSQDLNNVDEHLPHVFSEFFRVTFSVSGIIVLVASVNPVFLLYAAGFLIILMGIRRLYLPTGRSLKRLEAATRSPMIGHLNSSLEGLTTIRAYQAEGILIDEFDRHQDLFTSAHYTSICTSRAFGFFIDFICLIFIMSIVARFLFIDTDTSAGNVGLALTQVFMLAGHVQWGVRQWAELENFMTSVERLLEYTDIKMETTSGSELENWPKTGAVSFNKVSLTYNNNETVLKNLDFNVEPKQKIGIVGRTGAGKSSIISSLFRLYEVEGKILIDGIDIKSLNLNFLRKKLSIIPQDPVLFSGTLRTNLDPLNEFTDHEIWSALEKVNLKGVFSDLNYQIHGHGSKFSSGQKQLICLARAILRKNKVVILDEATANMDHETDALLHKTIKENFSDCTVFTIAHRLHSILDCDKVIVLDRGTIKEFDEPLNLLQNRNGMFYRMVEHAGLLNYLS